nr:hypothetical protein [Tanacetum cinerariifolium]
MYKEYLAEFSYSSQSLENSKVSFSVPTGRISGVVGINTFRNAIGAHYLPHSSKYVAPPLIDVVRKWFAMIGYGEEEGLNIKLKKKQREKVVPYTRFLSLLIMHIMKEDYGTDEVTLYPTQVLSVNNRALKHNQPKEPPFTAHMLAIYNTSTPMVFKAPKTSSKAESVSQGVKPGAQTRHKKLLTSSKQPSVSNKEATKGGSSKAPNGSKTGYSRKRKESSSAIDSNPSQPLVSIHVDTELHKEDQQATGGPTSLGVTSKERANPQLSIGTDPHVHAEQTKFVNKGLETVLTQPTTKKGVSSTAIHGDKEQAFSTIKLEDESNEDDLVNIVDESDKDKPNAKTKDTSVPRSSSPSSLPTELKDLPSKFNKLTEEIKGLKTQELPKAFLSLPAKVASAQAKLKTLDALPSLLLNVTIALDRSSSQPEGGHIKKDKGKLVLSLKKAEKESTKSDSDDEAHVTGSMFESYKKKKLNKFDFVTKEGEHIHLNEEQISHQQKLEEEAKAEAAKQEGEARKAELIDLLGPKIVHKYYKYKLQYDRDCDLMLNRRAEARITNCDVLTKKGPITLIVYREDGTSKVIPNFKSNDLHLGEWREVVKSCPNRKGKGRKTIYG